MRWFLCLILSATFARAEGERAGDFDYYVLALSWSPTFCAIEGKDRGNPQCDRPLGWVLHGLWPQYEQGWPSYCRSTKRNPSSADTSAMADIMGSSGSAWHQWKKHGRCSGLSSEDYYLLSRAAFQKIMRPALLRKLTDPVKLPAEVIEKAFLNDNPHLTADMITITCKQGRIHEARICLTRELEPRNCGADVVRDCAMQNALFAPVQ